MKKVLVLLMVAVIVVGTLASCGVNVKLNSSSATQATSGTDSDTTTTSAVEGNDDENAAAENLDVKEYKYKGFSYEYIIFVVTNKSKTDCAVEASVDFFNKKNKIVGTQTGHIDALGAGQTSVMSVYCNDEFTTYSSSISTSELSYYTAAKDLELEVTEGKNKLIAAVTNNGEYNAYYTTVNTLFFKGDDLVYYTYNYVGDKESKIAPGKTEKKEISVYVDYDKYENYIVSRGKLADQK